MGEDPRCHDLTWLSLIASINRIEYVSLRSIVLADGLLFAHRKLLQESILAISGFVDVCTLRAIGGWVWDDERPDVRLEVEILYEGRLLARVFAAAFRDELSESNLGDGQHSFWYLPESPLPDVDKVCVRVAGAAIFLPRVSRGIQIPTDELIFLVVGGANIPQFLATGGADYKLINGLLREAGLELKAGSRVLDWGCGCGRVARNWQEQSNNIEFYGCDLNEQLINWSQRNIPFGSFRLTGLKPPLPFPDGYFDVIYGLSVVTHLLFETQYLWMAELWRILKPGGVVILTAHGPSIFPIIAKQLSAGIEKLTTIAIDKGMFISIEEGEGSNATGNAMTADVMSKIFCPFRLINYRPSYGLMGIQDTFVFCKKSSNSLQLIPSLLECEMVGHRFQTELPVKNTSQRQCTVLASVKNLIYPANVQIGLKFPDSALQPVRSPIQSLQQHVNWTELQSGYSSVTIEDIPAWDGSATLFVEVWSERPLDGVVLRLDNCVFS